jgi:hypothetical protein
VLKSVLVVLFTAALLSCSLKAGKLQTSVISDLNGSPLPEGPNLQVIMTTAEELEPLVKEASVSCEDPNACPQAVGYLLSKVVDKKKTAIFQCTGFLIDQDTFVTNSHCVPASIRKDGANCGEVIEILFPGINEKVKADRTRCKTVIHAAQISNHELENFQGRDYAILKLTRKIRREPFKVSRTGLPDDTKLISFAVDPISDTVPTGLLKRRECKTVQGVQFAPEYRDAFAPIAAAASCALVQGNSGSPMVDENMYLKGILFGGASGDDIETRFEAVASDADTFEPMNAIVNSACMDLPVSGPREECEEKRTPIMIQKLNELPSDLLDKEFKAWRKKSDLRFMFSAYRPYVAPTLVMPALQHLQAQISCVQPVKYWPALEAHSVELLLPRWGFAATLDRYTRPTVGVEQIAVFKSHFTLSRAQITKDQMRKIPVTTLNTKGFMSPTFRDLTDFRLCY